MPSDKTQGYVYCSLNTLVQAVRDGVHAWTSPKNNFVNETNWTSVVGTPVQKNRSPGNVKQDGQPKENTKKNYMSAMMETGSELSQMLPTLLPVLYKPRGVGQAMDIFGKYMVRNMGRQLASLKKSNANSEDIDI